MWSKTKTELVGETGALTIRFDLENGSITGLVNERTGQALIEPGSESGRPWQLYHYGRHSVVRGTPPPSEDTVYSEVRPRSFGCAIEPGARDALLRWETDDEAVSVRVHASLDDSGQIELWPTVRNAGSDTPEAFVFPVIERPRSVSGSGEDDYLVFPAHSGWLIRNPLERGAAIAGDYPDSFKGCSIQAMGFFTSKRGGFYFATHDPHSTRKRLEVSPEAILFEHMTWDLRPGTDLEYGYPVVIHPLEIGDWYEVAEIYRRWALDSAPWTANGPRRQRTDDQLARWLHEEVGLAVWGLAASEDTSEWAEWYGEVSGGPVHIVANWDWAETRPQPLGYEGWFPGRFHPNNLAVWKEHRVTPHVNDQFISVRSKDFISRWEPNLFLPYVTFGYQRYSDPGLLQTPGFLHEHEPPAPDVEMITDVPFFLCPATLESERLHEWRNKTLIAKYGFDGVYHDISSGLCLAQLCLRTDHGHRPGWTRDVLSAYDSLNQQTHKAVQGKEGFYPAVGTELIIESMINWVDFYVARAGAGPLGSIEAFSHGPEMPPGHGHELIPFFEAVYHDYGPVREDGWLHIGKRDGELFYWLAARIMLQWGGIVSLEYALNFPEDIGAENAAAFVARNGATYTTEEPPERDAGKESFIRTLADTRRTLGNNYLAYGRLHRPPALTFTTIALEYRSHWDWNIPGGRRQGSWNVPTVVEAAWEDQDYNVGLFLGNIDDRSYQLDLDIDLQTWLPRWQDVGLIRVWVEDQVQSETKRQDGRFAMHLELPPRSVSLIEFLVDDHEKGPHQHDST